MFIGGQNWRCAQLHGLCDWHTLLETLPVWAGRERGEEGRVWGIQRISLIDSCEATNTYKFIISHLNMQHYTFTWNFIHDSRLLDICIFSLINTAGRNEVIHQILPSPPFVTWPIQVRSGNQTNTLLLAREIVKLKALDNQIRICLDAGDLCESINERLHFCRVYA